MRAISSSTITRLVVVAVVFGAISSVPSADDVVPAVSNPPRIPWKNTRLVCSPDPPPPYTVERTFDKIVWKAPLYVAPVPSTNDLLVVEQGGEAQRPSVVHRLANDLATDCRETLLEMDRRLIYGLTFHAQFESNGFLFVFSNGPWESPERANRVSRFTVQRQAPFRCDPASELILLEWASAGHDGGDLAFGNDGMLYIASGDGTGDSDTLDSGQDVTNLLGTLIRIDVDHPSPEKPYSVPDDNPLVHIPAARPEIWAYGFRNPWRMCVDAKTGDIWVGNNGQDMWETAHLVRRGDNCGWSVYEGSHPFYLHRRRGPTPIVAPTIEHPHSEFRSLTGGVVYHGDKFPELEGAYIYGDYSTGKIWGARHADGKLTWSAELADTALAIAAFRVDQRGELLIVDHAGGGLYRLARNMATAPTAPFPTLLSETGLFESVADHRPAPGLIPYSVNAPGWADGAIAERFMALPADCRITYASSRGWNFSNGAVLVQTLSVDVDDRVPRSRRRIETRLLVRQQNEWAAYSYRWNDEQTDAVLVDRQGEEHQLDLPSVAAAGTPHRRTWRFPGRTECLTCHSRAANYVLGTSELQMNRTDESLGAGENQLQRLERFGLFDAALPKPPEELGRLANPYDPSQPAEVRARSYLHANCSVCHVEAGGGNAKMQLEFMTAGASMNLIAARPQHDTFEITDAMLVAPGSPQRSVLLHRLSRRGRGQMPPLGTARVDEQAVALVREWIAQMKPQKPFVRDWTLAELAHELDQLATGRSLESGRAAFRDTGCIQCHRLGGDGGSVGPDLTDLAHRYTAVQVLESIVLPSKQIAEAYAATIVETDDGTVITGRIESEDDSTIVIRTGASSADLAKVAKQRVARRSPSPVSNMPAGIINVLQKQEVLDLLAYLMSDLSFGTQH